jgi:hypothetical protein
MKRSQKFNGLQYFVVHGLWITTLNTQGLWSLRQSDYIPVSPCAISRIFRQWRWHFQVRFCFFVLPAHFLFLSCKFPFKNYLLMISSSSVFQACATQWQSKDGEAARILPVAVKVWSSLPCYTWIRRDCVYMTRTLLWRYFLMCDLYTGKYGRPHVTDVTLSWITFHTV